MHFFISVLVTNFSGLGVLFFKHSKEFIFLQEKNQKLF